MSQLSIFNQGTTTMTQTPFPSDLNCPDAIFQEPEALYHDSSGCNTQGKNLSSHLLGTYNRMPYEYQQMMLGLLHFSGSKAYLEGTIFHTLVLEGIEKYDSTYAWDGPVNDNTGKPYGTTTKKWEEWSESMRMQGVTVITPPQDRQARIMATSVAHHRGAYDLLYTAPIREGVIRTRYLGFDCQIRMDAFGMDVGIVDLKSCADIKQFEWDARKFRYFNQLAFYREILRIACPDACDDVHIVATDKTKMNTTGVWKLNSTDLDIAKDENEQDMAKLRNSMQTGSWPTGYEDVRTLQDG